MSNVIELNEGNFEAKVLKSKVPVLVDFHSVFCVPCHAMKSVLAELADDVGEKAKVFTVEIGTNEALTEKYGIISIPTMIVFSGGKQTARVVGLKSKESLRKLLEV